MRLLMPTCREKIMNRHRTRLVSTILLLLLSQSVVGAQVAPADQDVRAILQDRVEQSKRNVGIVVGLISDKGTRVVSYGKPDVNSPRELDGDTVFEIGSVTKVFTSPCSRIWWRAAKLD